MKNKNVSTVLILLFFLLTIFVGTCYYDNMAKTGKGTIAPMDKDY